MEVAATPIILALALSVLGILALRRPGLALGLVDKPGGRKVHARTVPLVGGMAVLLAFGLALLLSPVPPAVYALLYSLSVILALVGLIDDSTGLPPLVRITAQLFVALLAVYAGGPILTDLGAWPGGAPLQLGALAAPITMLALVGFTNSLNMMDGADGLAGAVALVILAGLGIAAVLAGNTHVPLLAATLGAALVGFLAFNLRAPWRRRASVFLGDSGSLALGFALVWLAIETAMLPGRVISPLGIAWLLALPVIETLNLIIRRLMRGQNPLHPDREHLHHILRRAGFSVAQTTLLIVAGVVVLGAAGMSAAWAGVADEWLWLGLFILGAMHLVFTERGWRTVLALQRLRQWDLPGRKYPVLAGPRLSPGRQRLAVVGFYLLVVTVPFSFNTPALGMAALALAVVTPGAGFSRTMLRQPFAWVAAVLAAWVLLQGLLSGAPMHSLWHCLALSGVVALPLGWWLAGNVRHVVGGVLALCAALFVALALIDTAGVGALPLPALMSASATQGLLLSLPLLACAGLVVRQARRLRRARLREGLLGLLALGLAAGLGYKLMLLATPLVARVEAGGVMRVRTDLTQLIELAGLPALALFGAVFALLLWALWGLWQQHDWPRRWVAMLVLLAVVLVSAVAVAQPLAGPSGALVYSLGLAVLFMAAIHHDRLRRLTR